MLQRIRESCALLLIVLLPFHALLVTVLTKFVAGPGHAPLTGLALWKEGLLGLILAVALCEILPRTCQRLATCLSGRQARDSRLTKAFDSIDLLILALIVLAVFLGVSQFSILNSQFLFGFKYDLLPLIAFLVLRRVEWSSRFARVAGYWLLVTGCLIAVYGLVTLVLPESFFRFLGYSDLHSTYVSSGPIAAFQQIGGEGIRRIQSTFSGPNQMGLWMLIPWTMVLAAPLRGRGPHPGTGAAWWFMFFIFSIAILLTFSRTAWIGAAVIVVMTVLRSPLSVWERVRVRSIALIACISLIALLALLSPSILLRSGSTIDHFRRPIEAMKVIALNPFGLGLGSAGPAQNRVADACLDFPAGSDISWAKDRTDLCIFVDHVQRQPDISVRACRCPLLPENWYLQIGIELGIVGLVVYVILVVLILRRLHQSDRGHGKWDNVLSRVPYHMAHRVFLALSVAALFLHAFEDSAVSWTLWVLVAVILPIVWSRKAA